MPLTERLLLSPEYPPAARENLQMAHDSSPRITASSAPDVFSVSRRRWKIENPDLNFPQNHSLHSVRSFCPPSRRGRSRRASPLKKLLTKSFFAL
jgi:hypothetical protein